MPDSVFIDDHHSDIDLNGSLEDAVQVLEAAIKDGEGAGWQNLHLQVEPGVGPDFTKLHITGQRPPNEDEAAAFKARDVADLIRLKERYRADVDVWDVIVLEKANDLIEEAPVKR